MKASELRSPGINEGTGDKVLPLRFMDSNDIFQKLALDLTLRFDDVLDPEKLRLSLERLIEIGNWHQIGARYKKNAKGKLELHIPQQYDAKRPAFAWSHDNRQQSIRENELAMRLPQDVKISRPTLYKHESIFESLVTRPDRPKKLKEWTETDHPGLSLHVTSFTDATFVTLSWSHIFFDALGRQSLFQAWLAVLDGREEEVPELIPYEEDPVVGIAGDAKPEDHVLYKYALTGIWALLFVLSFIYELLVHRKDSGRIVRLPGSWVDELREGAMEDLRAKGVPEKDAFLTHGDVLLAFWCKITLSAQHFRPSQPVHVINAMNVRGISEKVPLPGKKAYVGNAVLGAVTLTTMSEIDTWSVGEFAGRLRKDLKEQRAPGQIKAIVAWLLRCFNEGKGSPLPPGSWNQSILSWSNWSRAKFYDMDFSSAVVKTGGATHERSTKVGRPSLVLTFGHADGLSVRNGGPLIGQDGRGDWWINWYLRDEAWAEVEEALMH